MSANRGPVSEWWKSSHSTSAGGECLEWAPALARGASSVAVRDSKHVDGPVLRFSQDEWVGFVCALKNDVL
ncbi:DUF397 domain-containing protein [Streptomyces sp. XM4193]|uniref:DUF397 domain-containing protein n=1 Tax=Streptomyces sp. XM4193 TaxID=2929782 RepID=UPI001FFBC8DF|nr:DUF397 domain-containing protein [Streptomyces sp. XM4193]MCK1796140.1 DUF397 domain-containing protein [Streptomyces sp. XM4193]